MTWRSASAWGERGLKRVPRKTNDVVPPVSCSSDEQAYGVEERMNWSLVASSAS